MRYCEFCTRELFDHASSCGYCGRTPTYAAASTSVGQHLTAASQEWDQIPFPQATEDKDYERDEEGKQHPDVLAGLGLAPLDDAIAQGPGGGMSMVQGTPQVRGAPSFQGNPQRPLTPPGWYPPMQPGPAPAQPMLYPAYTSGISHPPPHLLQNTPKRRRSAKGCLRVALVVFATCILLGAGSISAGLVIFSPGLSSSGSMHVAWGQSLLLHGNNFIPESNVDFTLDGTVPLYYASTSAGVATNAQPNNQVPASNNSITVSEDGTFDVTFNVSPNWLGGQHMIRATEQISQRSAVWNFTIEPLATATPTLAPTDTPTPTVIPSPTATPTATPSATVSPSPTATLSELSCVMPSSITLAANPSSNQASSKTITLCTSGSGLLNWTAKWDQKQAPWLRLNHSSGQIQAPAQGQVTVSAQASGLQSGNYTTTVTFSSQPANATVPLNVTFTVHSWCVSVAPLTLNFTGILYGNNPAGQTVTVKNCSDLVGDRSASSDADWLTFDPIDDTLSGGNTEQVTINTSQTGLNTGTYNGSVTFQIGSSHATVQVTLTVKLMK